MKNLTIKNINEITKILAEHQITDNQYEYGTTEEYIIPYLEKIKVDYDYDSAYVFDSPGLDINVWTISYLVDNKPNVILIPEYSC